MSSTVPARPTCAGASMCVPVWQDSAMALAFHPSSAWRWNSLREKGGSPGYTAIPSWSGRVASFQGVASRRISSQLPCAAAGSKSRRRQTCCARASDAGTATRNTRAPVLPCSQRIAVRMARYPHPCPVKSGRRQALMSSVSGSSSQASQASCARAAGPQQNTPHSAPSSLHSARTCARAVSLHGIPCILQAFSPYQCAAAAHSCSSNERVPKRMLPPPFLTASAGRRE